MSLVSSGVSSGILTIGCYCYTPILSRLASCMLFSNALAYMIPNDDHSSQNMFAYNVRSWPTAISSPLFPESLCSNQASDNALPRYGGDISSLSTTVLMDDSPETNGYRFTYDKASRLTQADYTGDADWYSTSYSYDKNGNITSLTRKGPDAAGLPSYWDDLTMTYDGNKLQKVTDDAPTLNTYNSMQYVDGVNTANEFSYDQNGNLTKDYNRKISSATYNLLNLPRIITVGIHGNSKYTENLLRVEHNLNQRIKY